MLNRGDITVINKIDIPEYKHNGKVAVIDICINNVCSFQNIDLKLNIEDLIDYSWVKNGAYVVIKQFENRAMDIESAEYEGLYAVITYVIFESMVDSIKVKLNVDNGNLWWDLDRIKPVVRYKVGDTVRIVTPVIPDPYNKAVTDMARYAGKTTTIVTTDHSLGYRLDIDSKKWWWSHSLLTKTSEYWPMHFSPKKRFLT